MITLYIDWVCFTALTLYIDRFFIRVCFVVLTLYVDLVCFTVLTLYIDLLLIGVFHCAYIVC